MKIYDQSELEERDFQIACEEWQARQPKYSLAELIQIFPEGRQCLREKLELLQKVNKALCWYVSWRLRQIHQNISAEDQWFFIEECRAEWAEYLSGLDKKISKIKFALYPTNVKGHITENQIEKAKKYPFNQLIEARRNWAHCPFHGQDKHPSLYIKNNFGYCFSCGWNGDTIKFLIESENLPFRRAVERLSS